VINLVLDEVVGVFCFDVYDFGVVVGLVYDCCWFYVVVIGVDDGVDDVVEFFFD